VVRFVRPSSSSVSRVRAALLAVRFVVFPQIESYRDTVAGCFARARATGGDCGVVHRLGWLEPEARRPGFRVLDARGSTHAAPAASQAGNDRLLDVVAAGRASLEGLIIEEPRLAIRRDRSGVLRIAGLEFDPAQAADELPITDWILRQRRSSSATRSSWDDDLRTRPSWCSTASSSAWKTGSGATVSD
jgi:hypothetical protein